MTILTSTLSRLIEARVSELYPSDAYKVLEAPECWGIHYQVRAKTNMPRAAIFIQAEDEDQPFTNRWKQELPGVELTIIKIAALFASPEQGQPEPKEEEPVRTSFPITLNPWMNPKTGATRLYVNGTGRGEERASNTTSIFINNAMPEGAKVWVEDGELRLRGCSREQLRENAEQYILSMATPF